jgi:DtxR family Mn-dependent transcriptional regulator
MFAFVGGFRMANEIALTNTMEDYLEAISVLDERNKYVRVKDIAKYMKVKMPTVTSALRSLAKKNLVDHERYEYVELTEQGSMIAQDIRRRHDAILKFLTEVLNVDQKTAEKDACGMEHAMSATTLDHLLKLIECMEDCPRGVPELLKRFEYYVEHGEKPPVAACEEVNRLEKDSVIVLRSLEPGAKAKVTRLSGKGAVRRRIMDMGIVPGTTVEVEKVAPLGDPIEVKLKGYHLSLRKEEAANIFVEVV